jgi:hypothetical protein
MKHDIQQTTGYFNPAVVVNQSTPPKAVHEETPRLIGKPFSAASLISHLEQAPISPAARLKRVEAITRWRRMCVTP